MNLAGIVVWLLLLPITDTKSRWDYNKACYGTENGMARQSDVSKLIKDLREIYSNCTKVNGNLEITGITMDDLKKEGLQSLDFFDNIEEVAGYVLIAYTILPRLSFPRLKIIWGDRTFTAPTAEGAERWDHFSLLVMSSTLEVLDMRSLRAVVEGRIGFSNTIGLCHWKRSTIDWNQILGPGYDPERLVPRRDENDTCMIDQSSIICSRECDHCWGSEREQCQQIYRTNCAPQCRNSMCFNTTDPSYCCSSECAAGCFGPTDKDCYGCRSMSDEGVCVDKCAAREVYDPRKMEFVHNPNGKYSWVRQCVKECPSHVFTYKDGCVARCPDGYYPNGTVCTQCDGPCPKRCPVNEWLSSMNIKEFVNCTVIEGKLEIRSATLTGGTDFESGGIKYQGLTTDDLETLSSIEEITHYLFVQSKSLTTLKFLRNLRKIGGRKKHADRYSIHITGSDALGELGLSGLKEVSSGEVYIRDNSYLCYVDTLPWDNISTVDSETDRNRESLICEREGKVCDELCDNTTGCWGKGPEMCFDCQYYKWNRTCIRECNPENNVYVDGKDCKPCHDQCSGGCEGPDANSCTDCKNALLGRICVEECPEGYFENTERKCEPCHENCRECSGPEGFVGPDGCDRCKYVVANFSDKISCLPEKILSSKFCGVEPDFKSYYLVLSPVSLQSYADRACLKCHDQCNTCTGYGTQEAAPVKCECTSRRLIETESTDVMCVEQCPSNTYSEDPNCFPCHQQCEGCTGPASTECSKCKDYKDDLGNGKFNCTDQCPPHRPHFTGGECSEEDEAVALTRQNKHTRIVAIVVVAAFFLSLIIVCTALFVWRRRAKALNYLQPPDEIFEMHPEAKPNLTRLRLVLETQLKKGKILGYGAFGTVFQGIWYPDEKEGKKTKVLVAIKVLHEANPTSQKEMLDEAGIMASMEHQYLAQLIGVCVGQQLMLVTPLFPLGNLLEYVQTNRTKIGSLALLRWCTQIATGMSYLEEHRLVHRDLAARNVLVQTPYHIRITDFGLAKMLEYGEEELKIFEGKMPIKWLALECIQHKRYTHKSDVWAFGVTVWELMTFGDKPYKDIPLQQIPMLLEKGDRLPQPKICSLDVYMTMIKCWMVDAHTRPSFTELLEEFSRMMKDPGRYLVIEGDALLRLPSCSSADRSHLLEQWADEEDDVVDIRGPGSFRRNTNSSPGTPPSPFSPVCRLSNDGTERNSDVEAARIRQGSRTVSTSSHRYASDPLKKSRRYTNPGKATVTFEAVPTDGDNYLVPDSQQRTSSSPPKDSASALLLPDQYFSKYTAVINDDSCPEEFGLDYYEYLKKAASGNPGEDNRPFDICGLENKEYMIGKNNNMKGNNGDHSIEGLGPPVNDPGAWPLLAEPETVL